MYIYMYTDNGGRIGIYTCREKHGDRPLRQRQPYWEDTGICGGPTEIDDVYI